MRFAGAGCAAAAIASRASTEQQHNVARRRNFAANILFRRCANNRADLHALGEIAGMIDFMHESGRQAELIAVRAVARRSGSHQTALGQFVRKRILDRLRRICRAGHAHRLIDIAASGQRIANRAADAGRRAAERLDLSRVIVGLVFEQKQPVFLRTVNFRAEFNRASVDFLRFVEIR